MPILMKQIDVLSIHEKMQVVRYLLKAIEESVANADFLPRKKQRCLTPDPKLYCEIRGDLFEDTSAEWENA